MRHTVTHYSIYKIFLSLLEGRLQGWKAGRGEEISWIGVHDLKFTKKLINHQREREREGGREGRREGGRKLNFCFVFCG